MCTQIFELSKDEGECLLKLAFDSIEYSIRSQQEIMLVSIEDFPDKFRQDKATFVTLKRGGNLRGCIGVTVPLRPLVLDVVHNAYAAAFRDPRFRPMTIRELNGLDLDITVLSVPEPIEFSSEQDLLNKMRPGIDGLILDEGDYRGAFLPVMWEQLPRPEDFLYHLKMKAGLVPDHWSDEIEVSRFTAECVLHKHFSAASGAS